MILKTFKRNSFQKTKAAVIAGLVDSVLAIKMRKGNGHPPPEFLNDRVLNLTLRAVASLSHSHISVHRTCLKKAPLISESSALPAIASHGEASS